MANKKEDEIADFSNFFNKSNSLETKSQEISKDKELNNSIIEESQPNTKKNKKRIVVLVIILIILGIGEVILLIYNNRQSNPPLPEGYRLVEPHNQPAYIEPIQ